MTKRLLLSCALLAAVACRSDKVTWRAHDVGPLAMEFPCDPKAVGTSVKCMRSDGAEYKVQIVEKNIPADEERSQMAEYAKAMPKGEVIDIEKFPLKWREVRQFDQYEAELYYLEGKEYTISVAFSSQKPPPQMGEFFSKVKVK